MFSVELPAGLFQLSLIMQLVLSQKLAGVSQSAADTASPWVPNRYKWGHLTLTMT